MSGGRAYLCLVILISATAAASAQLDSSGTKVRIKGKDFEIFPPEKLKARGMEMPDVPIAENAAWVYVDAMNALVPLPEDLQEAFDGAQSGKWPAGDAGSKLAGWLDQNRSALDTARRASTMPRHFMPMFRGESDMVLMALLPTLGDSRQIARMFAAESTRALADGRPDDALANCLSMQRMANQVGDGHTLIQGLVGVAVSNLAAQTFQRAADSTEVSAESLKKAIDELDGLSVNFPDWEKMVRAEQAWASSYVDDAIDAPGGMSALLSFGGDLAPQTAASRWDGLAARLRRVYLPDRAAKRHLREHYDRMIGATRHDDGSVGMSVTEDQLIGQVPAWDLTARLLMPAVARSYEMSLMARSNFERARLTLATSAYKRKHGAYPPALSALVPEILPRVPTDPMTGREMEYELKPDGSGHRGLEMVNRTNEEQLRQKRRPPTAVAARTSEWRRTVDDFSRTNAFSAAQRASAEAILKELETRATAMEAGARDAERKGDAARFDKLFQELRERLDALPTQAQRAAVDKRP